MTAPAGAGACRHNRRPVSHHRRSHRSRTLPRWPLGLAVCALLLAQWMSLVHAVAHGPRLATGMAATASLAPAIDASGWQAAASSHTEGSLVCHLLDHLVQPAPPAEAPPVLAPSAPAAGPPAARPSRAAGGTCAGYHARGPPAHA